MQKDPKGRTNNDGLAYAKFVIHENVNHRTNEISLYRVRCTGIAPARIATHDCVHDEEKRHDCEADLSGHQSRPLARRKCLTELYLHDNSFE